VTCNVNHESGPEASQVVQRSEVASQGQEHVATMEDSTSLIRRGVGGEKKTLGMGETRGEKRGVLFSDSRGGSNVKT